jgi:hypothetical protein
MYPGTSGKTQGDRNDKSPATNAANMDISIRLLAPRHNRIGFPRFSGRFALLHDFPISPGAWLLILSRTVGEGNPTMWRVKLSVEPAH